MAKLQTLADALRVEPDDVAYQSEPDVDYSKLTGKEFADAVLNSTEFKLYVINSLRLGTLPPAVIVRLIDHSWGKPPDRVEHTGKDGNPIVTEVRRVIVRASPDIHDELTDDVSSSRPKYPAH